MGIRSALCHDGNGFHHHPLSFGGIGSALFGTATPDSAGPRTIFSFPLPNSLLDASGLSEAEGDEGRSAVATLFRQNIPATTVSDTRLTVEGDGFFVFKEADNDTAYYSRAGAFLFDDHGYLVNAEGLRVQGKPFDPVANDTFLPADPTDIQVAKAGFLSAKSSALQNCSAKAGAIGPLFGRVAIDSEGVVVASSQGRRINIARLVLAKFQHSWGLKRAGARRYTASAEAGAIRIGLPGAELGQLVPKFREPVALDMGQEFVKRIVTRRGFQANPKIIATVDDMLNALINRRQ